MDAGPKGRSGGSPRDDSVDARKLPDVVRPQHEETIQSRTRLDTRVETPINVRYGWCPVAGRVMYGLWQGDIPVVAAVVYLRAYDDESTNALRRRAYALLPFFRWLDAHHIALSGFDTAAAQLYKHSLKRRVNLKEHAWLHDLREPQSLRRHAYIVSEAQSEGRAIARSTANAYLGAVYDLACFWGLPIAVPAAHEVMCKRGTGSLAHLSYRVSRRPALFRIRVRRRRPAPRRGLPPDLLCAVWAALERGVPRPSALLVRPTKTPKQRQRRRRAEIAFLKRRIRYYRDKAIWALMLASGCRIGEIVLVRRDDLDRRAGYLRLVYRAEDAHLGDLKTGPDDIYVGHNARFIAHIDEWETLGLTAVSALRRLQDADCSPEHPMLFSKLDGMPLTRHAIRRLFKRLDKQCGVTQAGLRFSPHITRHTIATVLRSAGVPLHVRQAFLRHRRSATTDDYGYMHDKVVRDSLARFWASGMGAMP